MATQGGQLNLPMVPVSHLPVPEVVWSDVARMCRRVCVLLETGRREEAEDLRQGALLSLLDAVRSPEDTDAAVAARLDAVFAEETERVANASVLAELLAPFLKEQLRAQAVQSVVVPANRPATPNPSRVPPPRAPGGSIADFIDAMIEQEAPADAVAAGLRTHSP